MKIGYVPYSSDLTNPSDRRRFPHYAALKGLRFELVAAPSDDLDVAILSSKANVVAWAAAPKARTRVIYELIDSHLARPKASPWWRIAGLAKAASGEISHPVLNYRRAIERMCRRADALICSSPEQLEVLAPLNDRVYDILDFHEEVGGEPKTQYEVHGHRPVLVWEGWAYSVKHLSVLSRVMTRLPCPADVRVITDPVVPRFGAHYLPRPTQVVLDASLPGAELRRWEKRSLPALVTECDVAVIPIDLSDPMARAKPENKLMLLWRLGMPVVTSATPAYARCMKAAGLHFDCVTVEDWVKALEELFASPDTRRSAADAGRAYVRSACDTDELVSRWDRALASAIGTPG